ncbi:MAG: stage II sporulation protein M [Halorientalis sp.]
MSASLPDTATLLSLPRRLWRAYRPYLALSAALFALGGVLGGLLVQVVGLESIVGAAGFTGGGGSGAGAVPEPTFWLLVVNNTVALVVLVASGLTLGLVTAGALLFNGALVGAVAVVAARAGPLVPVVGILPHGVLEVPALLFASAVAFRFAHQVVGAARGTRETVMTAAERREATALTAVAFALIPVAALFETTVTTALLARLVGG